MAFTQLRGGVTWLRNRGKKNNKIGVVVAEESSEIEAMEEKGEKEKPVCHCCKEKEVNLPVSDEDEEVDPWGKWEEPKEDFEEEEEREREEKEEEVRVCEISLSSHPSYLDYLEWIDKNALGGSVQSFNAYESAMEEVEELVKTMRVAAKWTELERRHSAIDHYNCIRRQVAREHIGKINESMVEGFKQQKVMNEMLDGVHAQEKMINKDFGAC
jgi:hypothetical protein